MFPSGIPLGIERLHSYPENKEKRSQGCCNSLLESHSTALGRTPVNLNIILFTLLFTVFGAFIGCLATLYILRRLINVRMKSFYKLLNDISIYRIRLNREHQKKINILKNLAAQQDESPDPLQQNDVHISEEEFLKYLNELNQLLQQFKIDPPIPKK